MSARAESREAPVAPTVVAATAGLVVTLLVIFVPGIKFAYRTTAGHLAMENIDASIAAVVAVLFYGRYRRSMAARDLLISTAFTLLAATGFMLVVLPAVTDRPSVAWTTWIPLVVRLFAAGLIGLAAANPRRVTDHRQLHQSFGVAALVLGVVILIGLLVDDRLPTPLDPSLSPDASYRPRVIGAGPVLAAQAVHGLLYGFAAVAFTLDSARRRDDLTRWLAVGCAFAAFARVNYFLFPSLYSQWLYTGDFLRTAFYLALGIGAVRELLAYWQVQAETAIFTERRRLARDLHDGTVQELGYIRSLAKHMQRGADPTAPDRIVAAAERAIAEARDAIAALTRPLDEPLGDAVRRAAGEIADRYDVDLHVDAAQVTDVEPAKRDAILRVVREAVSNAARHAEPRSIAVRVTPGCLEVVDDGRGFDVHLPKGEGFGLVSMRERAEAVGGQLHITSRPASGTTVRMVWP